MTRDRATAFLNGLLIGAAAGAILAHPAPANAAPCADYGVCQYMPNPNYNGPLMPTWDTPGYYGGWTNGPVQCNTSSASCAGVETEQGDE